MKVKNRLAGFWPGIDYKPVIADTQLFSHDFGRGKQVADQTFIRDFLDGFVVLTGDDQNMYRGLGIQVPESHDPIIFE